MYYMLLAYSLSLFASIKHDFFRLKENTKLYFDILIQAHEAKKHRRDEEKTKSFLSFQFRNNDEFVGKNGENLDKEVANYPRIQVLDDELFELDLNKKDTNDPLIQVLDDELFELEYLNEKDTNDPLIQVLDDELFELDLNKKYTNDPRIQVLDDELFELDLSKELEKDVQLNLGEELSSDREDLNKRKTQWEHKNLVEGLRIKIMRSNKKRTKKTKKEKEKVKLRAIGLPTIPEESEAPNITQDLKPLKIEHEDEDTLVELRKFYKPYRERMMKLDILNYQTICAIGIRKIKDPLESFTRNKRSNQSMGARVSLKCWSCRGKSAIQVEQPVKMSTFSRESEIDLEKVYVGQMCLSWEFLRLQYGKALKLLDSDLYGIRRYNQVADKFKQFKVLITRFLKEESFKAPPRLHHYANTRFVLRNLLQVPLIQEDVSWDKNKKERKRASGKDAVNIVKLVKIIKESIRTMRKFIQSDKCTSSAVLIKECGQSNVELQNPADADAVLLEKLGSILQKKEKRPKELTRSGNWILRRIRKLRPLKDGTDHVRYIFPEVDLKLVSRALNISKISSEQFGWCSDKHNQIINDVSRKLCVDSFFLLFP